MTCCRCSQRSLNAHCK